MFDEMPVMASKGLVKDLSNYLLWHHFIPVLYLILSFHSILGSGLGIGPEKLAQILELMSPNWKVSSTLNGMHAYERNFRSRVAPLRIA